MKTSLKGRRFVSIKEAADHIGVNLTDLYEWCNDNKPKLYAFSEYSEDIREIQCEDACMLLNQSRPLTKVRFVYPKSIHRLRLLTEGYDHQTLYREDMKLSVKDIVNYRDEIKSRFELTDASVEAKRTSRSKKGKVDDRGRHHKMKRALIETQVFKIISEPKPPFVKKNGTFNVDKIAQYLDQKKESWLGAEADRYGFGYFTIRKVVRKVLQENSAKKEK